MTKISLFNSLPAKGMPHTSSSQVDVIDFLNDVKFGKWRDKVEPIRTEKDKARRDQLKRALPSVTMSGTFIERAEAKLQKHSGFICIDIDGYTDRTALCADPHTYSLFRSASGNGLAVVVRINPDKHKDSFRWIQSYYFNTYGIVVDPAPQNVASLRYVTFDHDLYLNEKSKPARTLIEKKAKPRTLPIVASDDVVGNMVAECVRAGHNIAQDYHTYRDLSFSIASGFGESGRQWFHALCQVSDKYNSQHADKQFDIALRRGKDGITVGTFYWMLKQVGITAPKSNQHAVQVASIAKRSGRTKEGVTEALIQMHNVAPEQAAALVNEVFAREDLDLNAIKYDPERLIESLTEWIAQNHPLRRNTITRKVEEGQVELSSERMNTIFLRARIAFSSTDVNFDLVSRIVYSDFVKEYNPITEYIEHNRHRNTTGNVHALMSTIHSDTPGGAAFLYRWLLGIIACYHGEPVPYVLALVGKGGTGKTEWFRRLLPSALSPYYGESRLDAGKDDELLMCQKLIIMDDEMGGKSKQDEKRLKALTSKSTFDLRAPYARQNDKFKRLALLCGTSNETDIIADRTGNRRILVVQVDSIDHEAYNAINKDELFMEIVRLYEAGETWKMDDEERAVLATTSREFEAVNPESEYLQGLFWPGDEQGVGFAIEMMATQIKAYIETVTPHRITSMKYFGMELKKYFGPGVRRGSGMYYKVIKKPVISP